MADVDEMAGQGVKSALRFFAPACLTQVGGIFAALVLGSIILVAVFSSNSPGATCSGGASTGPGSFPSTSAKLPTSIQSLIQQNQSAYKQGVQGTTIPWQMMAAIHYREAGDDPHKSMFAGEPLGSINPDHGIVEGTTLAENAHLAAETLSGLGRSTYGDTFTSTVPVVAEYAVAYNRGSIDKSAGISPQRSPYAMNFFDAEHQHMVWPPGDPLAGLTDANLGAVTVYSILINQGDSGGCGGSSSSASGGNTTADQVLQWVGGGSIVLHPLNGNVAGMRAEIQNLLTQNMLNVIGAIHNKGYSFQINATGPSNHPSGCTPGSSYHSLHCIGRAIDIDSGGTVHPGNVFQLQKWLYDNRAALKLDELFGPNPSPCGSGCLSGGKPSGNFDNGFSLHIGVLP